MKQWANFPMGPSTVKYIGLEESSYKGANTGRASEEEASDFQRDLMAYVPKNRPSNILEFVDLLEEFTNMGMSQVTILLYETHEFPESVENFRAMLSVGSSYMMESDLEQAEVALKKAQEIEPSEASTYVNLANVYYAQHRDKDALIWAEAGLEAEPNHHRLWELIASIHISENRDTSGDRVRELAESVNSYAGLSLAAHLIDSNDPLLKAQLLEKSFDSGIRDEEFLVEYTAALGLAQQFEKIPALLWQMEQAEGKKVSWKIKSHVAQAFFALDKEAEAKEIISQLEKANEVPEGIIKDLKQTYDQQFAKSDMN